MKDWIWTIIFTIVVLTGIGFLIADILWIAR